MEETKLNVWNIEEQLLQSRIIKIDGEINTQMAQRVTSFLDVLANDDPNAVIKLEICSGGGSVLDGLEKFLILLLLLTLVYVLQWLQ